MSNGGAESDQEIHNLEGLLDRLAEARTEADHIEVSTMLELVGFRSFGALLLVPAVIVLSPLSGIPGLPSVMAAVVVLIAAQLLVGRRHFWLPGWVLHRRVPRSKFDKALRFLRPITCWLDKLVKPRLTMLTRGASVYLIALLCIGIAATMVPMELIPFGNSTAGAALTVIGLALIAHDGLLVLVALGFSVGLVMMVTRVIGGG